MEEKVWMLDAGNIKGGILLRVLGERERQDIKWGEQNHDVFKWCTILGEEYGEVCKAAFEADMEEYKKELVQTAAVCVAMLECIERNQVKSV